MSAIKKKLKKGETVKYSTVYFETLFVCFLLVLGYSMLRSFLPIFARELDPSGVLVGFSISSYFFARTFIELPSGFISDRTGGRKTILLGLSLSIVGSLVCAFSTSIYILISGLTLWGLGTALFFTYMYDPYDRLFRVAYTWRSPWNFLWG